MEDRPVLSNVIGRPRRGCTLRGCLYMVGLLIVLFIGRCYFHEGPLYYYSDPIEARVIAAETRQPVEGAIVVATWETAYYNRVIHLEQTVTDAQGRFRLDGLPLTLRRPLTWLEYKDPQLTIYKPGVGMGGANNQKAYVYGPRYMPLPDGRIMIEPGSTITGYSRAAKRFVSWNGRVLALWRAKTPEEEIWQFTTFEETVKQHFSPRDAPLMWATLAKGYDRIPPSFRKRLIDPRRRAASKLRAEER